MLRVTFLMDSLALGGAERQAVMLGKELHRRGHAVEFHALRVGGFFEAKLAQAGIPSHVHGVAYSDPLVPRLRRWNSLRRQLRAQYIDVLISYLTGPNLVAAFIWPSTGARTMIWNQR